MHGESWNKDPPEYPVPYDVQRCFYGQNGTRRNLWIWRWRRSGEVLIDDIYLTVPPPEMERFFYNIASREMIVCWGSAATFKTEDFLDRVLAKPFTLEYKSWVRSLFAAPDVDDTSSSSSSASDTMNQLIDASTREMVRKIVNTKLKVIRSHEKAAKLPGGVKFRDQRRVEADKKFENGKKKKKKKGNGGNGGGGRGRGGGSGGGRGRGRGRGGSRGGSRGGRGRGNSRGRGKRTQGQKRPREKR